MHNKYLLTHTYVNDANANIDILFIYLLDV